jgi:AcrR family transcriptional regulator
VPDSVVGMSRPKGARELSAQATRGAIVSAASRLFFERGYHGAGIDEIAAAAGVAVQTIYNSIGSKRDLLVRVLDYAASGERAPMPVGEIARERVAGIDDPRELIATVVSVSCGNFDRTIPVFRVIREAAAVDPTLADLERERHRQRLANFRQPVERLAELGALRREISIERGSALVFMVVHPDQYRFFVEDVGWSKRRWQTWATAALEFALLA